MLRMTDANTRLECLDLTLLKAECDDWVWLCFSHAIGLEDAVPEKKIENGVRSPANPIRFIVLVSAYAVESGKSAGQKSQCR